MTSATPAVTPLRQRMIEDMRMRKLSDKTQSSYIRAVRHLAAFLGRAPDTASVEHPIGDGMEVKIAAIDPDCE
jgi:integrase/recombinase XerD